MKTTTTTTWTPAKVKELMKKEAIRQLNNKNRLANEAAYKSMKK